MFCERCGLKHNGSYGKGRFCSEKCANSRIGISQKRTLKQCPKCIQYISLSNFLKHYKVCPGIKYKKYWKGPIIKVPHSLKCEFCQKKCRNKYSYRSHFIKCPKNPEKIDSKGMLGKIGWNKGLTKETDERVKKYGETLKHNYALGIVKKRFHHHSAATKSKLSIARSKILETKGNGGFNDIKWYKIKNILNEEFIVRGTWELKIAEELNRLKIIWKRRIYLRYKDKNNILRTYTPDFYLPNYNIYIEVKGYYSEKDKQKISLVKKQHKIKLLILRKRHIFNIYCLKKLIKVY